MDIPEFKSEAQRQAYWKKQRRLELQMADSNDAKISKAYHDVDFGVIPAVKDNRSIKEIERDTSLQMNLAKKNALTLMADDGAEADKLLDLIGKPNYVIFNRFAVDIINQLRGQIGRIRAVEAYREIDLYIALQSDPFRRVPPSAEQIDNLIGAIESRFRTSNSIAFDILQRLEAFRTVIESGSIPPDAEISISASDVDDAMSVLTEEANDDDALSSIEEKSSGITEESNTALLNEIESAAGSKGTPAAEETKDQPTGQPKGGDDDYGGIFGEPTGEPKNDTLGASSSRLYSKREIEGLQDDFNTIGNYYLDQLNMAEEDIPARDPKRILIMMGQLLEAIGEDMRTVSPKEYRRLYVKNENKIAQFLKTEREMAEFIDSLDEPPTTGSGFRRRRARRKKSCACGCGKCT
jgi:hypothetical protein